MSYTLTGPSGTRQSARSLAYAKALAPQLLLRMGTQHSLQGGVITVYETHSGREVGRFTTEKGWTDVTDIRQHTEPIAA